MTSDRDTTRMVRSWLEEGVTALPDRVLDGVLDQIPATRQRRSLWRRLAIGNRGAFASLASTAAAVVVVAVVGLGFASAIIGRIGPGAPSASPSPSPSPTGEASPSEPIETPLPPGAYSLEGFPVGTSFTVPSGWTWCSNGPLEQSICRVQGNGEVSFLIVVNVVADPCADALLDPAPGPSVDDLVSAISGLANFTTTAPIDIRVDGFAGKELTVDAPNAPQCSFLLTWATADRINGVGASEANLMRVVDVDGTRVVMAGAYPRLERDAPEVLAAMEQVMDSVTFTP